MAAIIKITYLAVFEPTGTGYSVYFPDLPGCVSYGEDYEEARKQAAEALWLHIYGAEKDGDEIPGNNLPLLSGNRYRRDKGDISFGNDK